jgi:K+-sensing histidine kinase KdpD
MVQSRLSISGPQAMEPTDAPDAVPQPLSAEEFASLVAHELRNPLNALSGWLHLLAADPSLRGDSAQRALGGARRALDQQLATIDLLARVLRLRSDDGLGVREPIDLGALLSELVAPLRAAGRRGGHDVHLQAIAGGPVLSGDCDLLRAALEALGGYALRHGSPGAPLVMGLHGIAPAVQGCAPAVVVRLYIDEGEAGRTSIWHAFGRRPMRLPLELLHAALVIEAHGGQLGTSGDGMTGDAIDIRFPLPEPAARLAASTNEPPVP